LHKSAFASAESSGHNETVSATIPAMSAANPAPAAAIDIRLHLFVT
jgi:hypothetical protein